MKIASMWLACCCLLAVLCLCTQIMAQTESGTVSGLVTDESGGAVPGADVQLLNVGRGTATAATTNGVGIYVFNAVQPGLYQLKVVKAGFKQVDLLSLVVNVQDHIEQNVRLQIGSVTESVTVSASDLHINTESAAVSTVVDRQFADKLPMNGRSFQTLIQLTPGVVLTANNGIDTGQFSINGQRPSSNYWMVDGVSANIGISTLPTAGNGLGGTLGSSSVLGGTNSLVSVDALQEFRIQTSTYAPEFGRTPGGQISIVTRSGTNQFHGTAFDYLRNDLFDANDWFANSAGLPKPKERQNDFGGTFSGPILNNRTFFFFSYEGLRLRLPQTLLTNVPDLTARQDAVPAMQSFLNAYPLPNGADAAATGVAQFNASFSNPGTLDAYSLRVDHKLNDKLNLFGRYNYSPSEVNQRGLNSSLSTVSPAKITTQTATVGATWSISPATANDFRFNYSINDASSRYYTDSFGGAVPLNSLPFPESFTAANARLTLQIFSLGTAGALFDGNSGHNRQRQIDLVDSVSVQKGSHGLKFGIDFRRLSPQFGGLAYLQEPLFIGVPQAEAGSPFATALVSKRDTVFLFRNLGVFAQDSWRAIPRLTVTYGIRWDVDFAPSSISGPSFAAVTGFNIADLSTLALAPAGTPPFTTTYGNVAPRLGIAYQLSQSQNWQTVLRGGFGLFYDLATAEAGNIASATSYPFGALGFVFGNFPLTSASAAPPPITPPGSGSGTVFAFNPNLQLPYSLQWNVALEQALGSQQTITASYIGAAGRRLTQTASISSPNSDFGRAVLVTNSAIANYQALQTQFQRRLSHGLQALASYTWSHSIDTASAGSIGNGSNALIGALSNTVNRGPSDFDIRNAFSLGLTYDLPVPKINGWTNATLRGWSIENIVQARSAPPVDVYYSVFGKLTNGFLANPRPDVISGQPLYLFGQYPGGKAFNPNAFGPPPLDPTTGLPVGQGDLSRNALRGFGAAQWDFAVHRDFAIRESLKLQFRAEMFNVLNHPNFGQPFGDLGDPTALNPQFGQSIQMLGQSLSGTFGTGSGGFNPLYQIGGPRSVQLALKLTF